MPGRIKQKATFANTVDAFFSLLANLRIRIKKNNGEKPDDVDKYHGEGFGGGGWQGVAGLPGCVLIEINV